MGAMSSKRTSPNAGKSAMNISSSALRTTKPPSTMLLIALGPTLPVRMTFVRSRRKSATPPSQWYGIPRSKRAVTPRKSPLAAKLPANGPARTAPSPSSMWMSARPTPVLTLRMRSRRVHEVGSASVGQLIAVSITSSGMNTGSVPAMRGYAMSMKALSTSPG